MPYHYSRLVEALRVIRDDQQRINALQAAKLARTQYRDGFSLRRTRAVHSHPIHITRDDDLSDDDYDPESRRKRRSRKDMSHKVVSSTPTKGKPKRKRETPSNAVGIDPGENETSSAKKRKSSDRSNDNDKSHAFITLKFGSTKAKEFLAQKLGENDETHINAYHTNNSEALSNDPSQWSLSSGNLSRANKSTREQLHDFELAEEDYECVGRRTLRSGKVRTESGIGKRKQDDLDSEPEKDPIDLGRKKRKGDTTILVSDLVDTTKQQRRKSSKSSKNKNPSTPTGLTSDLLDVLDQDNKGTRQGESRGTTEGQVSSTEHWTQRSGSSPIDAISISSNDTAHSREVSPIPSRTPNRRTTSNPTTPQSVIFTPSQDQNNYQQPISPTCSTSPRTQILTLTTSFSHPINFKSMSSDNCTFHGDYRHGIFGHKNPTSNPARPAQYLIHQNQPSQLIELDPTPNSLLNTPPDTMCITCAMGYLSIIRCPRHTFNLIPECSTTKALRQANWAPYVQHMTNNNNGNLKKEDTNDADRSNSTPLIPVCRLCPAPARHRCTAAQPIDTHARICRLPSETYADARARAFKTTAATNITPSKEEDIQILPPKFGCGLELCNTCAGVVRDVCGGHLEGGNNRAVILKKVRVVSGTMGARADVEFCFRDGLVWKAYHLDK